MKKITTLLIAFAAFYWQGHAQVLTEGFESGAIPAGWTLEYESGTSDWTYVAQNGDASITPRTGTYMAEFRNGTSGTATKLVTSALDVTTLTNPQLTFYYANVNWFGDIDELRVFYKSSAAGTWTQIGIDYTAEQAAWTEVRLLLPNPSNDYYIAFEATSNWARGLNLDDVLVDEGPTCTPTVVDSSTVVDDCGSSQFSVDVVVSSVGDGTVITDGIGGSFIVSASTVTAGPYANGDTITLTVEHSDGACDFSLGDFVTGCTLPGTICENSIIVGGLPYNTADDTSNYGDDYSGSPGASGCGSTSSYLNGDDVVYAYTATSDTSINVSMTPVTSYSGIFVYTDCADIGVNCVAGVANSGTTERNFDLTVINGTTYYFVISTWASPQTVAYTLDITENTCTAVTANYAVVNDCDVSGGFYIDVNVTDMGSATTLTVSDDQGNPSQPLNMAGTLQFGPYVNATDVVITINDDNDDDSCTVTSSTITQSICPPANDECGAAITLTVNADYACGTVTSGTVAGATNSGVDVCGGTEDDDVWYSFMATATEHRVSLINIAGSTTDMYHAVYDATPGCGALTTSVICNDGNTSNLTGLTIGNTYFVQVYTWTSTPGQTSTFDVCVGTPPSCSAPASLTASNQTETSADLGWTENGTATAWDIEWGTVGFTATGVPNIENTATNPHALGGLTASTSYDFYVRADCGAGDTSAWTGPYTFVTASPAPANDDCSGAEALTVNADYSCAVVTSGTVAGATDSGQDDVACYGTPNNDVWYSFTATATAHRVSLTNKAGSPTDMYMAFYDATPGCGSLGTSILCSDPDTANLTGLTIGTTYLVQVYTYSSSSGATTTFDICVGTPPPPPANETCATATSIACGDSISGSSEGSNGTKEGAFACSIGNKGVWYSFTGDGGDMTISVSGSFDIKMGIASGSCGALVDMGCEDTYGSTGTEVFEITGTTLGETYYVYLAGWSSTGNTTGQHTIELTCSTVSVSDFASPDAFTFYPNPVSNMLNIKAQNSINNVAVYNMLGQEVLRTAPNAVVSEVDMSNLQTGAYFVKVTVGNTTETIRVIKN